MVYQAKNFKTFILLYHRRQMLNQNPKHYFNQVAMIQSQYESKRKQLTNHSSLLQNRSPIRERQNTNSINTPSRSNNKISLSPLRSRRNEQSITSVRSTTLSRRRLTQNCCENHPNKAAAFTIQKENECFYFCEKCAIPLITNGFKLTKINEPEPTESPRIREINQFLKQLEKMDLALGKKKQTISNAISKGEEAFQEELHKVEDYYDQFYQIINEHKRRVIDEMKGEFQKSSQEAIAQKQKIEEAIQNSTNMREDIISSMNSVILEVLDREFRSVMEQYYENLQNFKQISGSSTHEEIKVRTLSFRDGEPLCQALIDGLVIEWDEQEGREEEQMLPESDRENPIQCLETEERGKSNLKELGGLFCSFDQ